MKGKIIAQLIHNLKALKKTMYEVFEEQHQYENILSNYTKTYLITY